MKEIGLIRVSGNYSFGKKVMYITFEVCNVNVSILLGNFLKKQQKLKKSNFNGFLLNFYVLTLGSGIQYLLNP